jgi:DNA-binding NtrC family response regulator
MKVLRKVLYIIIVENERIIRVPLADELREAGYRVQEFIDSSRALNAVERMPVDVVITDIKMPQMDGLELLSRIKSVKPDTPVIVMTAYGSEDMAIEAMERGAYDYIEKPFDLDEMLALLARIEERVFIDRHHT